MGRIWRVWTGRRGGFAFCQSLCSASSFHNEFQAEHVNKQFLSKSWPEKKEKKKRISLGFSVTP
ncbi:hypothetical protein NC652_024313 [Populus alba x Populus x berolinensis]|nr:hypothetical protein NC652_024313 [Populus alba x Populus x berolinensis]